MRTRILVLAAILSPVLTLQAIVDTNENGLSDLWEKQHNDDELFPETFEAEADPDADGWTNAQEAAAGTDPFSTAHPNGYLQPETTHIPAIWGDTDSDNIPDLVTPEVIQVSWPTIPGKQYTLLFSPDLDAESWTPVGSPFVGNGNEVEYCFQVSGSNSRFWRVRTGDVDTDNDGLTDAEEQIIGSSPYLADTDDDGMDDFAARAAGKKPTGEGSDKDKNGIPDNEIYSVVFEIQEESHSMPFGIGFEAFGTADNVNRYFTYKDTETYTVTGSAVYSDVTEGRFVWTSDHLVNGVIPQDGQPVTSMEGVTFSDWKSNNQITLGETEYLEREPTSTSVDGPIVTAAQIKTVTSEVTPWTVYDEDDNVVRSGTEVITITRQVDLSRGFTYQDLWVNHVKPKQWVEQPATKYSPIEGMDYNRAIFGDAVAAEYIRDQFKNNNFNIFGNIANPGASYPDYGSDMRLKSFRWRWIKFNPLKPFDYEYANPPHAVRQKFQLLVMQRDLLDSRAWNEAAPLADSTQAKGIVEIKCEAGEDIVGWQTVPLTIFGAYETEDPVHHANVDFSKVGYSHVWIANSPLRFNVFPPEPSEELLEAVGNDNWEIETFQIPADDRETWIQSNIQIQGYNDEDGKGIIDVEDGSVVTWQILAEESDNDGTLAELTTETENGHTAVKFTAGSEPRSRYKVEGRLTTLKFRPRPDLDVVTLVNPDGFGKVKTQYLEVVPGNVASVQLTAQSIGLPADGKSTTVLHAQLEDGAGNPVARGTDVYWRLEGGGKLIEPKSVVEGEDGIATVTLQAGTLLAPQKVVVEADGVVASREVLNTSVQVISFEPADTTLDISNRESTVCTIQTQGIADGAEITWHATKGILTKTSQKIVNNSAQATLLADSGTTGASSVLATIGNRIVTCEVIFTSTAPASLSSTNPLIASDEGADGMATVNLQDGNTENVPYYSTTALTLRSPANPGATASIEFAGRGSVLAVRFPFDSGALNQSPSNLADLAASLQNDASIDGTVGQSRQGAGHLEFPSQTDHAEIPDHPELTLADGSVLYFSIYPAEGTGQLIKKEGEYSAEILNTGILRFTIGSSFVDSEFPLALKKWHDIRVSIHENLFSLSINGQTTAGALIQLPGNSTNALEIGGFQGRFDEWRITRIHNGFQGIEMVAVGLDNQNCIQLDSNGEATFALRAESTGAGFPEGVLAQMVDVTVEVDGQTVTAKEAATVTSKGSAVLIRALAGKTAVIGTDTANLNRNELAESFLKSGVREADRAGALPKDLGDDAVARGDAGFLIAIWMEESVDDAGIVHPIMSISAQNLPQEIAATLSMLLSEMMISAGQRNSSEAFADFIFRNHKELLLALQALSQGDVDSYLRIAKIANGSQAFAEMSSTANLIGGGAASRISTKVSGELANAYEIARSAFNRRSSRIKMASFEQWGENIERQMRAPILEGIQAGADGLEEVLRDLAQALQSAGVIDDKTVAAIGAIYGFAHEGNEFAQDIAHPELFAKSVPILLDICFGAARGDPACIDAVKDIGAGVVMGPVNEIPQAAEAWEAGQYFNAGRHQASAAIGGVLVVKELKVSLQRGAYRAVGHGRRLKREIGERGEALAKARFEAKGYTDVVPIQNASGHGIDLIMRDKDGGIVVVEVKSHRLEAKPRVTADMETFAKSRLEKAIVGDGHWKNVDEETLKHAIDFYDDLLKKKVTIRGIVVNVDYALSKLPKERYYEWAKGIGSEIFESNF